MKKEKKISDHHVFSDLSEEKREEVQDNFDDILSQMKDWLKTNDEKYFFKLKKAGSKKERMFWYIMLRENVLNDFEAGKNVWIKIGKSKNVSKRKAQYDGADKWPMKLLATGHFLSVRDPNKFHRTKGELKWREIDCEVVIQRFLDQWAFDRHKNEWYLVNKAIVGKLISGFLLLDGHTLQDEESKTTVTRPDWIGELEKKVPDKGRKTEHLNLLKRQLELFKLMEPLESKMYELYHEYSTMLNEYTLLNKKKKKLVNSNAIVLHLDERLNYYYKEWGLKFDRYAYYTDDENAEDYGIPHNEMPYKLNSIDIMFENFLSNFFANMFFSNKDVYDLYFEKFKKERDSFKSMDDDSYPWWGNGPSQHLFFKKDKDKDNEYVSSVQKTTKKRLEKEDKLIATNSGSPFYTVVNGKIVGYLHGRKKELKENMESVRENNDYIKKVDRPSDLEGFELIDSYPVFYPDKTKGAEYIEDNLPMEDE
jgi:hypothetical protein